MARAAVAPKPEIPVIPDDRSEVIAKVTADPSLALRHSAWFDAYYEALSADVAEHVPNVNTEGGRDQIKALAFRVVKARTGLEGERKRLTEGWRTLTDAVNKNGKVLREKLEALEETARKPLVEWQTKDDARREEITRTIQGLKDASQITAEDTAATVAERLAQVRGINDLPDERFGHRQQEAQNWYDKAIADLSAALPRLLKSEADAAELAELRDRQAQADREAAAAQVAAARAEQDRQVAERAAEQARLQAEREAEERIATAQRATQAAAQLQIDQAERQLADERRQREVEQRQRECEEQARQAREQDEEHRRQVRTKIRDTLFDKGFKIEMAEAVVRALISGLPHVTINY